MIVRGTVKYACHIVYFSKNKSEEVFQSFVDYFQGKLRQPHRVGSALNVQIGDVGKILPVSQGAGFCLLLDTVGWPIVKILEQ